MVSKYVPCLALRATVTIDQPFKWVSEWSLSWKSKYYSWPSLNFAVTKGAQGMVMRNWKWAG